ncbi:MAG: DUF1002 domain-containing protein [Bacillota bacterium]
MRYRGLLIKGMTLFLLLAFSVTAGADAVRVISYGKDLTEDQRNKVYKTFGLTEEEKNQIAVTEVSNDEEKEYLQDLVDEELIGTKAISSAYVELLGAGEGIQVETHNINWVTPEIYANALATAEVKDARIIAAAPFPVSGTAALTGIFKAFESATGKSLSKESKDIANEEMVRTGEIAKSINDSGRATELIIRIKEEVIERGLKDADEIRQVIINISNELKINLTEEQVNQLVNLMKKINGLNLNMDEINSQLKNIRERLDQLIAQGQGIQGIFQRLIDFFARLFAGIRSLFGG